MDLPVVPGGPAAYFATLPVKAAVAAARAAGVPAAVSHSAGTFVCNHVFYGLLHLLATDLADELPHTRGGFVHVPHLPEQVTERPGPSMAADTIATGLAALTRAALATAADLAVPAGALH